MKRRYFYIASGLLSVFVFWTFLVRYVGVAPIGPDGSAVGLASLNRAFHNLTGVNMALYTITDWLGLVPIAIAVGFGVLGLMQWIIRKRLWNVDFSILVLGGFYIVTVAIYILFEYVVINYRPVLIDGYLEVSYPSSTTMLVMCVIPTAILQLYRRIKHCVFRCGAIAVLVIFTAFMTIGRLLSGVHWLSDIIGGMLLSAGLVTMYYAVIKLK